LPLIGRITPQAGLLPVQESGRHMESCTLAGVAATAWMSLLWLVMVLAQAESKPSARYNLFVPMGREKGGVEPPRLFRGFRPYSVTVPPCVLHSASVSDTQPFPLHAFLPLQLFGSAAVLHSALPLHALTPLHLTFPSSAGWTS
jgi:hypothetical protein